MYNLEDIKILHLEVTERCQAACPQCGRTGVNIKQAELQLEDCKKLFSIEFIQQLEVMYMCGNFGDPIIATDTLEIFEYFKNYKNIKVVNTGLNSQTGARIKKIKKFIDKKENFFMTYGDGLCSINLDSLIQFHLKHKKIASVTAVHPPVRFGELEIKGDDVKVVPILTAEQARAAAGEIISSQIKYAGPKTKITAVKIKTSSKLFGPSEYLVATRNTQGGIVPLALRVTKLK